MPYMLKLHFLSHVMSAGELSWSLTCPSSLRSRFHLEGEYNLVFSGVAWAALVIRSRTWEMQESIIMADRCGVVAMIIPFLGYSSTVAVMLGNFRWPGAWSKNCSQMARKAIVKSIAFFSSQRRAWRGNRSRSCWGITFALILFVPIRWVFWHRGRRHRDKTRWISWWLLVRLWLFGLAGWMSYNQAIVGGPCTYKGYFWIFLQAHRIASFCAISRSERGSINFNRRELKLPSFPSTTHCAQNSNNLG